MHRCIGKNLPENLGNFTKKYEKTLSKKIQIYNIISPNKSSVFSPKIKIEIGNTKADEHKKVPIYEVKPMKKEKKTEDKNTLEVGGTEHRRHKSSDKKEKKLDDNQKQEKKPKEEPSKLKEQKTETKTKAKNISKSEVAHKSSDKREDLESKTVEKLGIEENKSSSNVPSTIKEVQAERGRSREKGSTTKELKKKSRSKDGELNGEKKDIEKNLNNTVEKNDEKASISTIDVKKSEKVSVIINKEKNKMGEAVHKGDSSSKAAKSNTFANIESQMVSMQSLKPPNILVYADSINAKENVKAVLASVINNEK